jgi:predicted phage terminase large subunit-like protein
MPTFRPQSGPQSQFCASIADVVIYGGARGGGKSWSLVFEAARNIKIPGYNAILFRRTSPELTGGGSIWEESQKIYPWLGGRPRENVLDWVFPSGARIEFSHLQYAKDAAAHQSKQYALICFDELTHFTESQFWFLMSSNRSTCGVRPYIRAATNPDPDSWVRRLIDWWIGDDGFAIPERSGVVRWFVRSGDDLHWADSPEPLRAMYPDQPCLSLTFIPATLDDNKALTDADPTYRGKLLALPRVLRERFLGGNWDVRPSAGMYFQRSFFEVVDEMPAEVVRRVRGWDKAASKPTPEHPDPDWTAGVRYSKTPAGIFFIEHIERFREGPAGTESRIVNTTTGDGPLVHSVHWQDPGAAGKTEVDHYARLLSGYVVKSHRASKDKVTFCEPVSAQAEHGNVKVVRGEWNEPFFREAEAFPPEPNKGHDDQIDGLSVSHLEITGSNLDRTRLLLGM